MGKNYLGIDVGSGSVRVGAFDRQGGMKGKGECPIKIWHPEPDYAEQSSEDIWKATGTAVRECLAESGLHAADIAGLAFDATCSLVALADRFNPITISPTGNVEQNVIVWMDHRAHREADEINAKGHMVLKFVGGKISPEMEPPKLKWLKRNLPETWNNARRFMDLADYLVFRATGHDSRSLCTTVCKWTYLGHEEGGGRYDLSFFEDCGIDDLFDRNLVPPFSHNIGDCAGELTQDAASELGLTAGIAVGIGIIDAHAGGIGSLGAALELEAESPFDHAIALIGGTSSCHMAVSQDSRFIPGVWGPYFGAMFPGMWLNEGGQSATGSLVDCIIKNNASYGAILDEARSNSLDVYSYLNQIVDKEIEINGLAVFNDRHVLPYFHGNRSPRADSSARGLMSGLTLNQDVREVALWYGATIQAVVYGTRHIIEAMNDKGYSIDSIFMSGGHLKNRKFVKDYADITGCRIVMPAETEAVLLGGAVLASVAAGEYNSIFDAMKMMCHSGELVEADHGSDSYHDIKYEIFKDMYEFQKNINTRMKDIGR